MAEPEADALAEAEPIAAVLAEAETEGVADGVDAGDASSEAPFGAHTGPPEGSTAIGVGGATATAEPPHATRNTTREERAKTKEERRMVRA